MAFATINDVKLHLRKTAGANADESSLTLNLDSAEQVMTYLIGASSVVSGSEQVEVYRSGQAILSRRPLATVTGLTRSGVTLDHTQVAVVDAMGAVVAVPFGRGLYTATYGAGNAAVTANMKLACCIIAQHMWRLMNGGGGAPYPGQDEVTIIGAGYAVPNRALELLAGLSLPTKVGGFA